MSDNKGLNIDFKKICEICAWVPQEGQSYEHLFQMECNNASAVPDYRIVDVVHSGGLSEWALNQPINSEEELRRELNFIMTLTINSPQLRDKKVRDMFPRLGNFWTYLQKTDSNGKLKNEVDKIAEIVWNGELARKRLKERTDEMFKGVPDKQKYIEASEKIKDIWTFSDYEIEAIRYFVCQTRHENHNPSMNKSLYFASPLKRSGKSTVARTLVSILNGEPSIANAGKYESNLATEMQYNAHALPVASWANCAGLDEAIPYESKRMYGQIKAMLTSSSLKYNPKFQSVITLPAKRYYIFTSNEKLSEFIQDDKERRFISINMDKMPKQVSFEEIYDVWKQFCVNCEPEGDWQSWYNSFNDEIGLQQVDTDYYVLAMKTDPTLYAEISAMDSYFLSPPYFHNRLIKGKPTREEKKAINNALKSLFGEPYARSKWKKSVIVDVLSKRDDAFETDEDRQEYEEANKLPF